MREGEVFHRESAGVRTQKPTRALPKIAAFGGPSDGTVWWTNQAFETQAGADSGLRGLTREGRARRQRSAGPTL